MSTLPAVTAPAFQPEKIYIPPALPTTTTTRPPHTHTPRVPAQLHKSVTINKSVTKNVTPNVTKTITKNQTVTKTPAPKSSTTTTLPKN